jgi:hypothetical protein
LRRRLSDTIAWAKKLRAALNDTQVAYGERVHFRPSSTGVSMVGLLADRPQRGWSGLPDLNRVAENFEELFARHCRDVEKGRETPEKALQSFLIRDAYTHGRRMDAIEHASRATAESVELTFVVDEISLPHNDGEIVCDLLAVRRDGTRCTPVLLELKSERSLTRLVQQVEGYARVIDEHPDLFALLFSAILGEELHFDAPTEKWIVWPAKVAEKDPREAELAELRIRTVGYEDDASGYRFRVGEAPRPPSGAG